MNKTIRWSASLSGAALFLALSSPAAAETFNRCGFDVGNLSFAGSDIEQARCLLSRVHVDAVDFGPTPERLGPFLEGRVGRQAAISRTRLAQLLTTEGLTPLATTVNRPLSRARDNRISAPTARYFVIHDTSQQLLGDDFPPNDSPRLNRLGARSERTGDWVAHSFTNRLGQVLLAYDYSIPWRATQLELTSVPDEAAKGLFLNNELNQPRRRSAEHGNRFVIAPEPGFTPAQYDRLALLYILASVRAGRWMIPAFHGILDSHIRGAHDDPQNFDLEAWDAALARRSAELGDSL